MKIVIISDSHGNTANLKHVMGFAKKIKAVSIIHCGDWNNIRALETVLSFGVPLYSVLGNADIDPEIEKILEGQCKKFDRTFLNINLGGKKIGIVHNLNLLVFSIKSLNIVFFGHTHRQVEKVIGKIRMINPGALENNINFAVYDTKTDKVEFIHE